MSSHLGFESGCRVAELFAAPRVHLVHVIQYSQFALDLPDYSGVLTQGTLDALVRSSNERLAELTSPTPALEITRETRMGAPVSEIVLSAEECGALRTISRGCHRPGSSRRPYRSMPQTVRR